MSRPAPTEHPYTYADYRGWDEGRWELIDGELFDMSPAPATDHQRVLLHLSRQVADFLDDRECEVFFAPFDVLLPEGDESEDEIVTIVQPDLSVVCDPNKIETHGCRGAPDWIVEILSPSTAGKDNIRKRELYERHGVREYWLVHPVDRLVTVYRLDESGRFGSHSLHETIEPLAVGIFPELSIDWDAIFSSLSPP